MNEGQLECHIEPGHPTGCNCSRELLLKLTLDALGARPGLSKEALQWQVLKRYMVVTSGRMTNLPPGALSPEHMPTPSPPPSQPTRWESAAQSASISHSPSVHDAGNRPDSTSAANRPAQQTIDAAFKESEKRSQIADMLLPSADSSRDFTMQVSTPSFPQCHQESRDTSTLRESAIQLDLSGAFPAARLRLPINADWTFQEDPPQLPLRRIQGLFALPYSLHRLFSRQACQQAPSFVYWETNTNLIAFNLSNQLWYNAAKDCALDDLQARSNFWYLVICRELAHNDVKDHNSAFAQEMGQIVLTFSRDFQYWQARV